MIGEAFNELIIDIRLILCSYPREISRKEDGKKYYMILFSCFKNPIFKTFLLDKISNACIFI